MSDNIDRVVDILRGHPKISTGEAESLAWLLQESRLLATDLPAPDITSYGGTPVWRAPYTFMVTAVDGEVHMLLGEQQAEYDPEDARAQAYALLAAADHAEKEADL